MSCHWVPGDTAIGTAAEFREVGQCEGGLILGEGW